MNKTTLTILILFVTTICNAQTTQIKYYNNEYLQKEVSADKAKVSETITNNTDGTVTTEIKKLKTNKIIGSVTYKGEEPFGIWVYQRMWGTANLDFNFPLKYSDEKCNDNTLTKKVKDYFQDNDSIGYKAPKFTSAETIFKYIGQNLIYPAKARESGTQGKVTLTFTITQEGNTENISITKSANVILDKEAFRIIREMKFSTPPTLNGEPQSLCVTMPVSFRLM